MKNIELIKTVEKLAHRGRGILAADESLATIKKRFDTIHLESTEETHRTYRDLLFTIPNINHYISGIILFEETLYQKTNNGILFPDYLNTQGIIPGIKVDKGLIDLALSDAEKTTQGLDGLAERLAEYKHLGAKFAKWRCVYNISDSKPSIMALCANAELLARYAAICQAQGIVPIVEPEVLINGKHTIERCQAVIETVLIHVFAALHTHNILLEGMILKPSMVTSGEECSTQADANTVAEMTLQTLKQCVPAAVPSINFLSGGQSPEQATLHLNLMNKLGTLPWNLSFSYGRALQEPCLQAWLGKEKNIAKAQAALLKRMQLNSAATLGEYTENMESEA